LNFLKENDMARIFIVDQREFPDPDSNLTIGQVWEMMASFFPELANATHTERQRGDDTLYEFQRRVGTKG
jgi:PRTRC genetic system protein C